EQTSDEPGDAGSDDAGSGDAGSDDAASGDEGAEGSTQEPVEIPETDLGVAAAWILDIINGDVTLTVADVQERFAPVFIDAVGGPEAAIVALQGAVVLGPFTVVAYAEDVTGPGARLTTPDGDYTLQVTLDSAGLITGA